MPLAFWCILIAGILPVLTIGIAKAGRRDFDNAEPRAWLEQQQGLRRRADYAHRNHFEAFPFFAVAVLAATQLDADPFYIDALAIVFVLARLAYTAFYLADKPSLRSVAWFVGYASVLGLFGVAAFGS
ncbi:putative MAPEG superfamily protein [Actimicrobium sp. GrIS 1.19]|uniref:MAPEG family protein n=1 Tax=Actimicrobium sp. GrIS 1.19 TaxID=3071708 RepID=UPI002E0159DC|nr:putative MAPEG superfamily protein [Actimicrobium sp. GrIS 1.19]